MVSPSLLGLLFSWMGVFVVLLSVLHVLVCVFLLLVVLLQRGRTGDVMSAFGGAQQSSQAAMSTDDLFSRLTKIGAFTFMATSLLLALLASQATQGVMVGEEALDGPAEASGPADAAAPTAETAPAPLDAAPPLEVAPTAPEGAGLEPGAPGTGEAPADAVPAGATSTGP